MPERSCNDFSCAPVQDVADRIRHNQCAYNDVPNQKAGCGDARLHSVVTLASKHFPDGRSCTDTNIAFLKLRRGGRLAGLVSEIGRASCRERVESAVVGGTW